MTSIRVQKQTIRTYVLATLDSSGEVDRILFMYAYVHFDVPDFLSCCPGGTVLGELVV